jgi:DinB superfamily
MKNDHDKALRQQLVDLLKGGGAHAKLEDIVADFPAKLRGQKPSGMPHSPWMLLEHLRIGQRDILEFSRNPQYLAPRWPEDYWPKSAAPPGPLAWSKSIALFRKDLKSLLTLVTDPQTDLFARIPWGDGQTILREALLVADHNAYHLAQLVDARRLLGAWKR